MNRRRLVPSALLVGATLLLVAGCSTASGSATAPKTSDASTGARVLPDSRVAPLVKGIAKRSVAPAPTTRLAAGLVPPTNKWFSGLVFGDKPQPVFPLPLSFGLQPTGFAFGQPAVTTGADTISAPFAPSITVDTGASSSQVSAYDTASVTVDELDSSKKSIGAVTIAEGSPLVSFAAKKDVELKLGSPLKSVDPGLWSTTVGGIQYGLSTKGAVSGTSVKLTSGENAVWFAVPKDGDIRELAKSVSPIQSVDLNYSVDKKNSTTTLNYKAAGDTLIAAMPHQQATEKPSGRQLGTYESAYGTMTLSVGTTLSWTSPAITPSASLTLSSLDPTKRDLLTKQVAKDAAGTAALPGDTYFGGKSLYRLANILDLAEQLGDKSSAKLVSARLDGALTEWMNPKGCTTQHEKCFVYDPKAKGMVGLATSFGSEQFNDHHFHYGYFFYAASVAAKYDPALVDRIRPVMTLLAADLATSGASTEFPQQRVFDAYAGHSWASGYSPFADGNNQESSSEAVNAWNGLALWADVTKDHSLATEARWMLSSEIASANAYWTNFDTGKPVYKGYAHSIASLNWGGKRDYATWFSAEPAAKLAILALPMSPVSGYLGTDPKRVDTNLAAATAGGYNQPYGDFLLMYGALGSADKSTLLAKANALPDTLLDNGNSRSYLLAWLMTR